MNKLTFHMTLQRTCQWFTTYGPGIPSLQPQQLAFSFDKGGPAMPILFFKVHGLEQSSDLLQVSFREAPTRCEVAPGAQVFPFDLQPLLPFSSLFTPRDRHIFDVQGLKGFRSVRLLYEVTTEVHGGAQRANYVCFPKQSIRSDYFPLCCVCSKGCQLESEGNGPSMRLFPSGW